MKNHGGDIYRNKVNIDFSVNVSPYGIPPMVRAAVLDAINDISSYPDHSYEELRTAIAKAEGVTKDSVVCGNGASELIYAATRVAYDFSSSNNRSVSLLVPCFSEYEEAALAAGYEKINKVHLDENNGFLPCEEDINSLVDNSGLVIIGNPNNPTGKLLSEKWIKDLVTYAEKENTFVIIDETFLDLTEKKSAYTNLKSDNLIRIKGYTKSMAIPGIRIGFLLSENAKFVQMINSILPDWNVSVVAQKAGLACAYAGEWLYEKVCDKTDGIKALRDAFSDGLKGLGIKVFDSDANYLLIKSEIDLYEKLLDKKILIRDCSNFDNLPKGYYRVAVKSREENDYLLNVLSENVKSIVADDFEKSQKLLSVKPAEIEKTSFSILSKELEAKGIYLTGDTEPVIKRCIHTTADFSYANTLTFSDNAVAIMKSLIREGACIVTDTNMGLSGINKTELSKYGGEAICFMADPLIAKTAKERGCTRASASMEHASTLGKKIIFVVGNAPTALVSLCEMMDKGIYRPDFVIGVPVGFVNVEQAKEMVMQRNINYIVNRGRKGGSNVAAAIVNAVLYSMKDE